MIKTATSTSNSWIFLSIALSILYVAVPSYVYLSGQGDLYFAKLALVTAVAVAGIVAGFHLPILDRLFEAKYAFIQISSNWLQVAIWGAFLAYACLVLMTAESIPFLTALKGSTPDILSAERGAFLKTRHGWEAALPYIGTVFLGVLLPYATARLFVEKSRWRFVVLIIFVIYTLLSLEKSLFILALAPIAYLIAQKKSINYLAFVGLFVFAAGTMFLNVSIERGITPLSLFSSDTRDAVDMAPPVADSALPEGPYFTQLYRPKGTLDQIVWRAVSVTVFTASDALRVFDKTYNGNYLLGATSSFVAAVTRQTRVNYDAEVFAYQFGRSEIGRANSVFVTEAFVNFGWIGVGVFAVAIGLALRCFERSSDEAFKALWPLFCWYIFTAGLMGALLSNGYALIFFAAFFVRIVPSRQNETARQVSLGVS